MQKFATNVFKLSHKIIEKFEFEKQIAIDCTLGTGKDTDFLSRIFKKVVSFDIQKTAIDNYISKKPLNVDLIYDSHEYIDKYVKAADCIIYNLGYLPGSNKKVTTLAETTLKSIEAALKILNNKGIIMVAVYRGHEEGVNEEKSLLEFLKKLNAKEFTVFAGYFINRNINSPFLITIEKNN